MSDSTTPNERTEHAAATQPTGDAPPPANQVPPRCRRATWIGLVVGVVLAGPGAGGFFLLREYRAAEALRDLPAIDVTQFEPSLAKLVTDAGNSVRARPRDAQAWGLFAGVLLVNDCITEAAVCYAKAQRFDPREFRWPYLRGVCLARLAPSEATACFQAAVRLDEDVPLARIRLAERLVAAGQLDDAERQLRAAPLVKPSDVFVLTAQGRLAFMRGKLDRALEFLERARNLAPQSRPVHELMAQVHQRRGDTEAADTHLAAAQSALPPPSLDEIDPFLSELMAHKRGPKWTAAVAERLVAARRISDAIALLKQAGGEDSPHVIIVIMLGKAYLRDGKLEAAEQALARARKIDPNEPPLHFELGNLALHRQQWLEAAEHYRTAVALKPDFAVAHYNLGLCQRQLGNRSGAIESLRQAVRYMPGNYPAHRDLAELLIDQGDWESALPHVQIAARMAPNDPGVGRLLAKTKRESQDGR